MKKAVDGLKKLANVASDPEEAPKALVKEEAHQEKEKLRTEKAAVLKKFVKDQVQEAKAKQTKRKAALDPELLAASKVVHASLVQEDNTPKVKDVVHAAAVLQQANKAKADLEKATAI